MEGEERGLSSGERRHGVRRGRCIMLGVSNWAPISPPVLGRLLFLAAPLTIPVPAATFVGLVLGVVFVVGLLRPRHPLVPCCRCQQFVLVPIIIKMIWKKNILQAQKMPMTSLGSIFLVVWYLPCLPLVQFLRLKFTVPDFRRRCTCGCRCSMLAFSTLTCRCYIKILN